MAKATAIPEASDDKIPSPGLDDVVVWLTFTLERDYARRGVFPAVRRSKAVHERAGACLFYLTQKAALGLLRDAEAHRDLTSAGVKHAYTNLIHRLSSAIAEAEDRRKIFEATEPHCESKSEYSECWIGRKEQFAAIGVHLDGPWPGESGGNRRWVKITDARGYPTSLSKHSEMWGTYRAYIEVPKEARLSAEDKRQLDHVRTQAQEKLDAMPKTAEEFRRLQMQSAREVLSSLFKPGAVDSHGYSWPEDSVCAILMAGDAIVEAILQAEIAFDSARHQQIAGAHRQQIARADIAFQQTFKTLIKPNPQILDGRTSS
jgi:hypothetical protein